MNPLILWVSSLQLPLARALFHLPQEPKTCGRLVEAKWKVGARAPLSGSQVEGGESRFRLSEQ
jgi:hypothetical protein